MRAVIAARAPRPPPRPGKRRRSTRRSSRWSRRRRRRQREAYARPSEADIAVSDYRARVVDDDAQRHARLGRPFPEPALLPVALIES